MADNYLSSVKIGGNDYEIYAKSALSAGWVPASAVSGTIAESSISSVPESTIKKVSESAITSVNQSAISGVGWSAISGLTASSGSDTTAGIWTPSATREYVTDYVAGRISNVYKFKGTCTFDILTGTHQLTAENGDVWDLANGGTINPTDADHSATVVRGDNVAWITAAGGGYWDKLAESVSITGKLDYDVFTAWSANDAGNSQFLGSANSALSAGLATNIGDTSTNAAGTAVIASAEAGSAASAWVSTFTGGQGIGDYLDGDGTQASPLHVVTENSIGQDTDTTAIPTVGAITSYTEQYLKKTDVSVSSHQLVINNQ